LAFKKEMTIMASGVVGQAIVAASHCAARRSPACAAYSLDFAASLASRSAFNRS
jgi:hypothetical protein